MAQNRYIRPLSNRYHDFTQQKLEQTFDEIPYKFRNNIHQDQYIKKPRQNPQPFTDVTIPPVIIEQDLTCCQKCAYSCNKTCPKFSGLFSCCFPSSQVPNIQQPTCCDSIFGKCCRNNSVDQHNREKVGKCCIRSFQPELCHECIQKLCPTCFSGICLKFRMCSDCKNRMCPMCKQSLCCVPQPKIRDYPIRIKDRHGLHFNNCQCQACITLKNNTNTMPINSSNIDTTVNNVMGAAMNPAMGQPTMNMSGPPMANNSMNAVNTVVNASMGNANFPLNNNIPIGQTNLNASFGNQNTMMHNEHAQPILHHASSISSQQGFQSTVVNYGNQMPANQNMGMPSENAIIRDIIDQSI